MLECVSLHFVGIQKIIGVILLIIYIGMLLVAMVTVVQKDMHLYHGTGVSVIWLQ